MTDKPLSAAAGPSTAAPSLAYMAPAWFAVVMGWSGLAGAWLRAEFPLGEEARALGTLGAVLAALVFMALGLASLRRLRAHPAAVRADMLHPVRHAFMATLPISMLLLAGLGVQLAWRVDPWLDQAWALLWIVGSVLELAATVWVIGRWLQPKEQGGPQWPTFTPALFIPVVGNVLAPLAGVPLGFEAWAMAQFGVGVLLWPILQALLFVRLIQAGPLPARLLPMLFIPVAPPSIVGLVALQLQAPTPVAWAIWGVALFFVAWALSQWRALVNQAFGMPHWGVSFPMAACSALTLRLAQTPEGAWLTLPALALLAFTTLVILGLTLNTLRGLRQGHLLQPEG